MATSENSLDTLQQQLVEARKELRLVEADRDERLAAAKQQLKDGKEKAKQLFLLRVTKFQKQIKDLEEVGRANVSENAALKDLLREADVRAQDADVRAEAAEEKLVSAEEMIRAAVDDAVALVGKERDEARACVVVREEEVSRLNSSLRASEEEAQTFRGKLLSERKDFERCVVELEEKLLDLPGQANVDGAESVDGVVDPHAGTTPTMDKEATMMMPSLEQPLESDPRVSTNETQTSLGLPSEIDERRHRLGIRFDAARTRVAELQNQVKEWKEESAGFEKALEKERSVSRGLHLRADALQGEVSDLEQTVATQAGTAVARKSADSEDNNVAEVSKAYMPLSAEKSTKTGVDAVDPSLPSAAGIVSDIDKRIPEELSLLQIEKDRALERVEELDKMLTRKDEDHHKSSLAMQELMALVVNLEEASEVSNRRIAELESGRKLPELLSSESQSQAGALPDGNIHVAEIHRGKAASGSPSESTADNAAIHSSSGGEKESKFASSGDDSAGEADALLMVNEQLKEAMVRIEELEKSKALLGEELVAAKGAASSALVENNTGGEVRDSALDAKPESLMERNEFPLLGRAEGGESIRVLESKVTELERLLTIKNSEVGRVREKARAYLKDLNAEKKDMELRLRASISVAEKRLAEEQVATNDSKEETEQAVQELDGCLALIADKQKAIQALNMSLESERAASSDARAQADRTSAEFESYKERARLALEERDSALDTASNGVETATAILKEQLQKAATDSEELRRDLSEATANSAKMADAAARAAKAEAALNLVRSDTAVTLTTKARRIESLEEELESLRKDLATCESVCSNAESRLSTAIVRLEVSERALNASELTAKENARVAEMSVARLREQVLSLERTVTDANASAAAAQRTAAVAARAMAYTTLEDEAVPSASAHLYKSPSIRSDVASTFSVPPLPSSPAAPAGARSLSDSPYQGSGSFSDQGGAADLALKDAIAEDVASRDNQIAVLMSQISELGALLSDVQEEYACREQQIALLKTEVRDLDAKLAASGKLSDGTPFELLRTTVLHYMRTGDSALLPVLATSLGISADEMVRVRKAQTGNASAGDASGYLPSFMRRS